jgi:hypothetical protein
MELLEHINSLKYKNETDLVRTLYATELSYTPPKTKIERPMFQMGSQNPRRFSRNNKSGFVGVVYPVIGDIISIVKEDKFRIVTPNNIYITENMELLNDNENARCYAFVAKNIISKENKNGTIKIYK